MQPVRHAVIDVGTNSVKLLVAEVQGGRVAPVLETSRQTRLGRGSFQTGRLQSDAIRQTAEAVSEFANQARAAGAVRVRVLATNAAREAANAQDFIEAVRQTSGLKVEIISGTAEAALAYRGVLTSGIDAQPGMLLLDVGGGSTEFIIGNSASPAFIGSFPLGTVRLMESFPIGDPPGIEEYRTLQEWLTDQQRKSVAPEIHRQLPDVGLAALSLVGTGGTATLLARMAAGLHEYDREKIEAVRLTAAEVVALEQRLWSMSLAGRRCVAGLPPEKADVILTGTAILRAIMTTWNLPTLRVSMRGLRFGALLTGD